MTMNQMAKVSLCRNQETYSLCPKKNVILEILRQITPIYLLY
jgi:hypothetical protein